MTYTLRCKCCGDRESVFVHRMPIQPLEISRIAVESGWVSRLDQKANKILVFCTRECEHNAQDINGNFVNLYDESEDSQVGAPFGLDRTVDFDD